MAKVRVYELAKEFGVESSTVMVKLQEMGEFVRSASSTIEAPVVRRLKEAFGPEGGVLGRGEARSEPEEAAQDPMIGLAETPNGGGADYQLVWPRLLFQNEIAALVKNTKLDDWEARCALLLEDAFAGAAPRDDFMYEDDADHQKIFLVNLLRRAHLLKEARTGRAPYWSERRRSSRPGADHPLARPVREFVTVVGDLEARGYFENAFDTQLPPGNKDCVDASEEANPSALLEREIGVAELWPLRPDRLTEDRDIFCDVVEVLHDLVARPRARTFHSGCGWHYLAFSLEAGRAVYRWQVNRVLDRSDLGLRLANEGEDAGRLVAVTDPARMDLASSMASRTDPRTGDVVRHAIALFRGRNASEHEKRSGVVALAGVLEERRTLLKAELMRKDEGALFDIANNFAVRHRRDDQRADYDPAFFDWVFWWYLATIELTDRILAREETSQSESDQPAWQHASAGDWMSYAADVRYHLES